MKDKKLKIILLSVAGGILTLATIIFIVLFANKIFNESVLMALIIALFIIFLGVGVWLMYGKRKN